MTNRSRNIIVQKYGGSSVADAEKVRTVAERICRTRATSADVVVTVSAMGDTTDELIALANAVVGEEGTPVPREMDTLLSTGELVSASLMAMAIRAQGHDVISLSGIQAGIKTDSHHQSARIVDIDPTRIYRELDAGRVVVVAGFQGLSDSEDVTTLGRGASDTTAVALAARLGAARCEIYTDVDGIYTTDPRIVPEARKLAEIDYGDMLELASLGAKMNPRSIELGAIYGVPILVASTFEDLPGTLIHGESLKGSTTMEIRNAVTAVEVERDVAEVSLCTTVSRPGTSAALFESVAERDINVDVILANDAPGDDASDITFTVAAKDLENAISAASEMPDATVESRSNLAKVSIVGTGMQNSPGYAARMFRTLSNHGVNIHLMATAEVHITCIVDESAVDKAAAALTREFVAPIVESEPKDVDEAEYPVTGLAIAHSAARITVRGVVDHPGVAAGIFEPLADAGISVDVLVQTSASDGRTDMAFTVDEDDAVRARETVEAQNDVEFNEVVVDLNMAKVSVVGTGLQSTPGQAAKMFRTMAITGVNIRSITTADIRITCLVDSDDVHPSARALHSAFNLADPR